MQKIKLLYNPASGDTAFPRHLDQVIAIFQAAGYQVMPYRSMNPGDLERGLWDVDSTYAFCLAAGGDGTVHQVINAMMKQEIDLPLGILPTGTYNEVARYLHMPLDIESCCRVILQQNIRRSDIGKVNDHYFINAAGGGFFTDVSHNIDIKFKNLLGRLAYYLKGIEQLPDLRSFKLRFSYDQTQFEEEVFLFLVLNGNSVAGIDKWSRRASICDGRFDVLVFRVCSLPQMASLFIKILRGEHLHDPHVIYFQTDNLHVSLLNREYCPTDIDGEKSPPCPLQITLLPKKIRLFTRH